MSGLASMELSQGAADFVAAARIDELLGRGPADAAAVRDVLAKSLAKQALNLHETAVLLAADGDAVEAIYDAARQLKRDVYGNRIVLFAPLYIGNDCVNDCAYCAFRRSNAEAVRRTLSEAEVQSQVRALEDVGHKRLILVFGEHPHYDAQYIAQCVRTVYGTRSGEHGEIRRVNINAAPLDHEGYAAVHEAGIGTYQVFQETYHRPTYERIHPRGTRKGNYMYRLDALARAFEAGCDDVGIGALFGLADWRYEVLSLVAHALHLQGRYGVGPHTISFPRLRPACGTVIDETRLVSDEQFKRVIATLRLAVPYTGLILTARERPELRREVMGFGVSQIDAGSRIEIGGYTEAGDSQMMDREQFQLGDIRPLDAVMRELMEDGYVPSFCTSCYRLGRTGEHFMEFAIPGFIQNFCTPNALVTLEEYLLDYATPATKTAGERLIAAELAKMPDEPRKGEVMSRLESIKTGGKRDLVF